MSLKTFVINLERSPARRRAIESHLDELGVPFEWVRGTDGLELTESELRLYSAREAFASIGRAMHRNEMGCILSHITVWREILKRGLPRALILEDDMVLEDDFASLVEDLTWVPADAAIVNMSWDMAEPIDLRAITPKRSLCRFDRTPMRAGSYIVTQRCAAELLEQAFPIRMPSDSLIGRARLPGTFYGVTPRPVRWNDGVPSDTWTDRSMASFASASRSTIKGRLLRMVNRLLSD